VTEPGLAHQAHQAERERHARAVAAAVPDPELPMLTLADLGILRDVSVSGDGIVVTLTPTYLGCPALAEMSADVTRRLAAAGFAAVQVQTTLTPPWTSDWITPAGRRKLAAAGIAPPGPAPRRQPGPVPLTLTPARPAQQGPPAQQGLPAQPVHPGLACPACSSPDTVRTAAFGATACRDLYRCQSCREPFEHIREI
jgi:ring-1,2-phenylacetyl-CoA epoxidase subunit PaaD